MAARQHPGWRPHLLRHHRDALGMTLEQSADAIRNLSDVGFRPPDATFQSIGRHERGEVYPGPRYRRSYCLVYGQGESDLGFRLSASSARQSLGRPELGMTDVARLGLTYPADPDQGISALAALWHVDADDPGGLAVIEADPRLWSATSLAWALHASERPDARTTLARVRDGHGHVGQSDVLALRTTARMFKVLDFHFGGGHARHILIEFLHRDVAGLLRGTYSEAIGRQLFSAAAEAILIGAWMAYDTGRHGLAQRYFIQALGLAEAAGDRLLAGEILGRMSHQATYTGRFRDAADLARAATVATSREANPTLTAEFFSMEARAHARHGDATACDAALSAAEHAFDRREPGNDPEWADYFDESELAAEFAHCHRDLGRSTHAVTFATHALTTTSGQFPRSDFFVSMVRTHAYLDSDDPESACAAARVALGAGDQLKSARCAQYVADFRTRLARFSGVRVVNELMEEVADRRLWQRAG